MIARWACLTQQPPKPPVNARPPGHRRRAQVDKQRTTMHASIFHGLFGGTSFYNHMCSTRMLPLRRLLRWTRAAHTQLGFEPGDKRVLFAASHK